MEENNTLIIWFENGKTALFEKAEKFMADNQVIGFEYFGKSTQTKMHAAFILENIAGFAGGNK